MDLGCRCFSSRRRDDGTQGRSVDSKWGRSRGQPRLGRRAKTCRITSDPGKSAGVGETGGSGRSSEEGRDNITRPEPRTRGLRWLFIKPEAGGVDNTHREGKTACERRRLYQTSMADFVPLFNLTGLGRVGLIEGRLSLKPYWGKLNVRNFREDAGNVSYGGS